MEIQVAKNETLNIDENSWPDKITKFEVDGELTIINTTDEVKLLELNEGLYVNNRGKVSISGKLVELGTSNGETSQSFPLPIEGYSIAGLWIETAPGSGKYEIWRCINLGGLDVGFDAFANDKRVGRVFRIEDNKIVFSDSTDYSCIPDKDCKIMIPNIIIATTGGDSASSLATINSSQGGEHIYRNVSFGNMKTNISGAKKAILNYVSFYKNTSLTYLTELRTDNFVVATDSQYSSGIIISYCSVLELSNTEGQSYKSYGLSIQYNNGPELNNVVGYTIARDSGTDSAINIGTVSNLKGDSLRVVGAELLLSNVNSSRIDNLTAIDSPKLNSSSSYTQSNVKIDSSNEVTVNNITIPAGGAAYSSPVFVVASNNVTVSNVVSDNDGVNYGAILQVAFGCKLANFKLAGVKNTNKPVSVDNRSANVKIQNFDIGAYDNVKIGGLDVAVKGLTANDIVFTEGSSDSVFSQVYTGDNVGKIVINLMENKNSKIINGAPSFLYTGGLDVKKDDVVEIYAPHAFRGITLKDSYSIDGGDDNLRIFVKAIIGEEQTDWILLSSDGLTELKNKINNRAFRLGIRIDASQLETDDYVHIDKISIDTEDNRALYPIFLKKINITFDSVLSKLPSTKYALLYADTYKNGTGVFLRDADGNPIVGNVDGKSQITYEYDFDGDNTAGRTPGEDFNVVCVCIDGGTTEPVEFTQTMQKEGDFNVSFSSKLDKALEIYYGL